MSEKNGGKAQIDFLCVEEGCGGVVKFDLMSLAQEDFQVLCPVCQFPAASGRIVWVICR